MISEIVGQSIGKTVSKTVGKSVSEADVPDHWQKTVVKDVVVEMAGYESIGQFVIFCGWTFLKK